ncbi:hypothetical protein JVU11DRAFT_11714 [Chiua virens]|nr:hypothetical protein JVU11DRAFT_11714 [Chiua virens]
MMVNRDNYFGYIDSTNPAPFGLLRFLTDELLEDAEGAGDRVWIIGHVLAGLDGSFALSNPSRLYVPRLQASVAYRIVDRFSPHVIANILWGHTRRLLSIFYTNNGTVMNADTAVAVSLIYRSFSDATGNLNSGFRMYEVDSATFDVLDSYTWMSAVN